MFGVLTSIQCLLYQTKQDRLDCLVNMVEGKNAEEVDGEKLLRPRP